MPRISFIFAASCCCWCWLSACSSSSNKDVLGAPRFSGDFAKEARSAYAVAAERLSGYPEAQYARPIQTVCVRAAGTTRDGELVLRYEGDGSVGTLIEVRHFPELRTAKIVAPCKGGLRMDREALIHEMAHIYLGPGWGHDARFDGLFRNWALSRGMDPAPKGGAR